MPTQSVHIAIPEPTSFDTAYNQRALPQYLHALHSAGATPIPIPLHESPQRVARILSTVQGILLPGSPADIDPEKYAAARQPHTAPPDAPRTAVDELLLQDAFNLHKPIFAICQGLQSLNTWCGGTLIQDIPTEVGTIVNHAPGRTVLEAHPIAVTVNTCLSALIPGAPLANGSSHHPTAFRAPHHHDPNTEPLREDPAHLYVNSSHHQAIRTPGDNLIVSAISPADNVIEAVELASPHHWVVAVQWHPERTYNQSTLSRNLFHAFVHAAQSWTPRKIEDSVVTA
ncbi:gamma-glutamyl-gamma-aminobutyrate hydrolase family protein [Acidicapsa dinghuensis]|uniref:Gamma-glutamyl-gamma-aminobutyrate hydrolase family protein n=1 Tax=Acidicapsa dinghuensis TaxID=2218256 RepID=A0ABW1EAJ3_9BACT|nr:gamma-glutamyl-gamma-aminobutyrate hydrolase family protein [Acidicapsa dinghuensis]